MAENIFKNGFQIAKYLTVKDAGERIKTTFYNGKNYYKPAIVFRI